MVESLQDGLSAFFAFIPQLIGAILILVVGYIVARILQTLVARVLRAVGFDRWMEHGGIKQFFDRAQTRETPAIVMAMMNTNQNTRIPSTVAGVSRVCALSKNCFMPPCSIQRSKPTALRTRATRVCRILATI